MTDRLTASTITDAQLDELYARAEQAEAMLGRVAVLGSDLFTGAPGPERDIGRKILTVLSLPRTGPAATEATQRDCLFAHDGGRACSPSDRCATCAPTPAKEQP